MTLQEFTSIYLNSKSRGHSKSHTLLMCIMKKLAVVFGYVFHNSKQTSENRAKPDKGEVGGQKMRTSFMDSHLKLFDVLSKSNQIKKNLLPMQFSKTLIFYRTFETPIPAKTATIPI